MQKPHAKFDSIAIQRILGACHKALAIALTLSVTALNLRTIVTPVSRVQMTSISYETQQPSQLK